jgi:hypothetical protein
LKSAIDNLYFPSYDVKEPKTKFLIGKFTPSDNVVVHAKTSIKSSLYAFSISFLTSIGKSP